MNLLASPLPDSVRVGGASIPIRTGYRVGIQVARLIESELPFGMMLQSLIGMYFAEIPANVDAEALLDAAMEFHRCGAPAPKRKRGKRVLDWDHDAGTILADFRREYGIDLADASTRMHWWVFMAYFNNLSSTSEIKTAIHYRSAGRPKGLTGEDLKRFNSMKRAYALPPRTEHEALSHDAELWGE